MIGIKYRAIALITLFCLIISGCDEKPVQSVDYEGELRRFIMESIDGQELFATDIYPEYKSFARDGSEDLYYYEIENVSRSIIIDPKDFTEGARDIYPFNDVHDVVATVDDFFTGNIYRIRGDDTSMAYKVESSLQRSAYFLKLYGDAYQYHGWRFWGYSTLNYSIDGRFSNGGSINFDAMATPLDSIPNTRLGRYYVVKNEIPKLTLGDSLTFSSNFWHRIFAENSDESKDVYLHDPDNGQNNTGWRIPLASSRFFHLITFEGDPSTSHFRVDTLSVDGDNVVVESTLVKDGDYVIPYTVDI